MNENKLHAWEAFDYEEIIFDGAGNKVAEFRRFKADAPIEGGAA